jgi:uncharacterized protein DUF4105
MIDATCHPQAYIRSVGLLAAALISCIGCRSLQKIASPSNNRNWSPDQAILATAEYQGNQVTIHNVRKCRYFEDGTYVVNHADQNYHLDDLQAVDFFMIPFDGMPSLAHTMLSFEFRPAGKPPQHLAISVEIRKEEGETYAAWKGSARQYELMYVVADEPDVIALRTNQRNEQVYLYRTKATPEQARRLLVDVLGRVNELASRPEFYDTFANNCTTNIVRHINRIHPNRVRYDLRVLMPGYSDNLAFDEGLIESKGTFQQTKVAAHINAKALAATDQSDFSATIRR